jgi:lipopolysaccharide/colanic/teichoic acid biosynthesis glycosyltransferase
MTGLWQVSGRSDLSRDDSGRLDLQYVRILARTVGTVLQGGGAY